MIKLRTTLPIIALSLASLSLASNKTNNVTEKPKTEITSKADLRQKPDKYESSEKQDKDNKNMAGLIGLYLASIVGVVSWLIHDNKQRKNDPEYAKICEKLETDYVTEKFD